MKFIKPFLILWAVTGQLTGTAPGPVNILDSKTYLNQNNSDSIFLGKFIPKHIFLLLTEKDKFLIIKVLMDALETSPSYTEHKWNNLDNSHTGSVTVEAVEEINSIKCRRFNAKFLMDDQAYQLQGQACRASNKWIFISPE